jgi:ABC-type cobalamin/Fe3+-siderophores transport system ATPase subunit
MDIDRIPYTCNMQQDSAMIIAVHDFNLAYSYADSVLMLSLGRMVGYGKPQEVLTRNVYAVYTGLIHLSWRMSLGSSLCHSG